jgi:sec-independent protein translocase protein TatA
MLGQMDLVLIGGAVLLFFGPGKIPELMKGLGKGLSEFKKAQNDFESEIKKVIDAPEVKTTKSEKEV